MKNQITTHNPASRTSFALPFVTALLMVICIMLAMVSINAQAYRLQQETTKKHLLTNIKLIEQVMSKPYATNDLPPLPEDIIIFVPELPLTDFLKKRLNQIEPLLLSQATKEELGWKNQKKNAILAKILPNIQPTTLILKTIPNRQINRFVIGVGMYLSLVILGIMLCYGTVAHLRALRRLHYISCAASEIVEGNSNRRIPINPAIHDEYTRLSRTLNTMLDKNSRLMQELRQVNNNVAHDLKSPLNRIRSRMDVALLNSRTTAEYEKILANSINDVDNLLKTFNALLLIGNLDSNSRNYQLAPTSLSGMLVSLGELYEAAAEEKDQNFDINIVNDSHIFANPNLFSQAISNILDNAIKYTPTGGLIQFSLRCQGSTALIIISDNGPGIPFEHRHTVFERFTRLDSARQMPGSGLGMSLVSSILRAHHATIQLHDNSPGLRVEIRLRCL